MTHHILKSYPSQFERMKAGTMKATTRYNDRHEGYKAGDSICFMEGEPSLEAAEGFCYTGRVLHAVITGVDDFGCQSGFVALSIDTNSVMVILDDLPECLREQAG